jgi:hypothetical protein
MDNNDQNNQSINEIAELLKKLLAAEKNQTKQESSKLSKLLNSLDKTEDYKEKRDSLLDQRMSIAEKNKKDPKNKDDKKPDWFDKKSKDTDSTFTEKILSALAIGEGISVGFFTKIIKKIVFYATKGIGNLLKSSISGAIEVFSKTIGVPLKWLGDKFVKGLIKFITFIPDFLLKKISGGAVEGLFGKVLTKLVSYLGKFVTTGLEFLFKNSFKLIFGALDIVALPAMVWGFVRGWIWNWVKGNKLGEQIFGLVDGIFTPVNNFFDHLVSIVKDLFSGNSKKLWSDIGGAINDLWSFVKGLLRATFFSLKNVLGTIFSEPIKLLESWKPAEIVIGWIKKLFNAVISVFTGIWDGVKDVWNWLKPHLPKSIVKAVESTGAFISDTVSDVSGVVSSQINDITTIQKGPILNNDGTIPSVVANLNPANANDRQYGIQNLTPQQADNKDAAIAYLMKNGGFSRPQAEGIVANLIVESKLNPGAVGDNGQAYGIAQWHPDRQKIFGKVPGHEGQDIHGSSMTDQLDLLIYELGTSEMLANKAVRNTTTAGDAAAAFDQKYERESGTQNGGTGATQGKREALANSIDAGTDSKPSPSGTQTLTAASNSVIPTSTVSPHTATLHATDFSQNLELVSSSSSGYLKDPLSQVYPVGSQIRPAPSTTTPSGYLKDPQALADAQYAASLKASSISVKGNTVATPNLHTPTKQAEVDDSNKAIVAYLAGIHENTSGIDYNLDIEPHSYELILRNMGLK